jgi:DNA-directed RNA polymerase subunit RPC12/RpoP
MTKSRHKKRSGVDDDEETVVSKSKKRPVNKKSKEVHFADQTQEDTISMQGQRKLDDTLEQLKKAEALRAMQHSTATMLSTSANLGRAPSKLPSALMYSCGRCSKEFLCCKTSSLSCPDCKYKIVWKTSQTNSFHFLTTD